MFGTKDLARERSRRLVLEQIMARRDVSRQEIVDATGLSKAAISDIVSDLMASGLIHETGRQNTAIGRPRISLSFIPDARYLIGAEINNHECRVVLTNLHAEPLRTSICSVASEDLSPEALCRALAENLEALVQDLPLEKIVGMGVAIPGVVDPTTSTVLASVILPWHNVAFGDLLRNRIPYPALLFSRGSAATWGERWYGIGRNIENMLYVRVGSGVVAGLVVDGKPYWGPRFGAGELGHVTVQPDGELCRCGNRGCLATVATVDALVMRVRQLLREDMSDPLWEQLGHHIERLDLATLVEATAAGNATARRGFVEVAKWLAIAISSAVHLLDLQVVVIGGPIIQAGPYLLDPLRAELAQRTMPTHFHDLQLESAQLNENGTAIGAASLMLHELVSSSRISYGRNTRSSTS